MKLAVTQTVLGVLVILSASYITGWMIYKAPESSRITRPDDSGGVTYVEAVPEHEALFTTARYGSGLILLFGLAILITATVQSVQPGKSMKKLTMLQVICGTLIAAMALIIISRGFPTSFIMKMPEGSDLTGMIFSNPGRSALTVQAVSGTVFVLGLAILGCGIARLLNSIRASGKTHAEQLLYNVTPSQQSADK